MRLHKLFLVSILILFISSTFPLLEVNASTHELEELDIHVFIHEDGSADITENRIATLSEGTENFIVIGNLGQSTITDFTVYEDGEIYEYVDDWNIDWSREEKAFKNSIIEEEDHYELAWGIGKYGEHEYELHYTITDFIKQLEDSQMMFWQFVNSDTNIPPQEVKVTVETDQPITEESERIWAFGFEGDIHFVDGKIVTQSHSPLQTNDYVTILTEFPDGDFETKDVIDRTFEDVKEQAFEGSDYSDNDWNSFFRAVIVSGGGFLLFIGFAALLHYVGKKREYKKRRKPYEGKYYREIPYKGEFYNAFGLLSIFQFSDLNELLSAFILKWIKDERLRAVSVMKKGLFRNKEITELHIVKHEKENLQEREAELFQFFITASEDDTINQRKFRKWAKKNYKVISKWHGKILNDALDQAGEEGFMERKEAENQGKTYKTNHLLPKSEEFKDHVYMFENFLKDFSLLNEREAVNVKLWDELMIWASLLGLTEEVYEQFKELYPAYEEKSTYNYATLTTVKGLSRKMGTAVTSATSGAGGSSSAGGGGGSFGGGSGGGTR